MNIKSLLLTLFVVAAFNMISAQTAITPPFQCGFENAAENANWKFDQAGCPDQWVIGSATSSEGRNSLYISIDGGATAGFDTLNNIAVVSRDISLPPGQYDLSFDWKCNVPGGGSNGGLYVFYVPTAFTTLHPAPNATAANTLFSTQLLNVMGEVELPNATKIKQMASSQMWSSANLPIQGGSSYTLYFVWVNDDEDKITGTAACVDNINITKKVAFRPTKFSMTQISCDEVLVSWENADSVNIAYREFGGVWKNVVDGQIDKSKMVKTCLIKGLEDNTYDFRIRGIEGSERSAWVTLTNQSVFCPEANCFNIIDLEDPNIKCFAGKGGDPYSFGSSIKPIYDIKDPEGSRHTVCLDRTQTDPNIGSDLKVIPGGEIASVRLGNWLGGGQAERIEFTHTVDTLTMPILIIKYAVVLEDKGPVLGAPLLADVVEPSFSISLIDYSGLNEVKLDDNCVNISFIVGKLGSEWKKKPSTIDPGAVFCWKDWATIGVDLTKYHEQTIVIRFETADRNILNSVAGSNPSSGGYAYFTLSCADNRMETEVCADAADVEIEAPEGFLYRWYNANNPSVTLSSAQTYTAPPTDPVYVTCVSKENPLGCSFTLKSFFIPRIPKIDFSHEFTPSNCKNIIKFTDKSYIATVDENGDTVPNGEKVGVVDWTFEGTGIIENSDTEIEVPAEGGNIKVTLMVETTDGECSDFIERWINVPSIKSDPVHIDTIVYRGEILNIMGFGNIATKFMASPYEDDRMDLNFAGCDSVTYLKVTILDPDTIIDTICAGDPLIIGGNPYADNCEGLEIWIPKAGPGPDSLIYLYLSVIDSLDMDFDIPMPLIVCADEKTISIPYTLNKGTASEYSLEFGDKALAAGFVNVTNKPLPGDAISIELPDSCRPEHYDVDIIVIHDSIECGPKQVSLSFSVYYSSDVIGQKWNNVLAVKNSDYNGGYNFSAFQWYRNGQPVPGEIRSYIYLGEEAAFDTTDVYHAVLMRADDGMAIPTCPVTIETRSDNGGYPSMSVARAGAPMRIANLKREAVARLYGVSGILYSMEMVDEFNPEIELPSVPGVYILSIESDGQTTNHKIVVK